ncbi:SseB family protein [Allostreptomyces psammosilenae]|uniref:SseB protein N-terminal domain-containing protein n=1 Tax=Allostreptomyces psammosilenae TaxID=1892865 RepID=A0A853A9D6_9ACTN|nr:SseB family protein [Allostreptomyces psammosilenae]NYI07231.1 hypothetical protein [Allostreptomyces psammosilenae]
MTDRADAGPPPGVTGAPDGPQGSADTPVDLGELARRALADELTPGEFRAAFHAARVYCPAPERPGLVPLDLPDGERIVPVFSSPRTLGTLLGAAGRYFSTTGEDLLDLLPEGYDLLLDPGDETSLRLRAAALRPPTPPTGDAGDTDG